MARMIPATIDPDTASPGEKDVFHRLQSDPIATDWAVLHSLDLPRHVRQISGELDFVVLIPGSGVLCLEIKAAASISRREGLWYYGHEAKGNARSPFRQAAEGMHSLREVLRRRYPATAKMVFWSAVILPYTSLDFASEEWHSWQLIDGRHYRSASLADSCLGVLARARDFLTGRRSAGWFDPASPAPTAEDCGRIVSILRPEEQFGALDGMTHNSRVVFEGPAGSGKTLLAIEAARRGVAAGKRTLLICYNRLLGTWLRSETAGLGELLSAGTLHSHMLRVARLDEVAGASSEYWSEELPLLALERLLDSEGADPFDLLLADEAQDLLADRYLDVLDLSVSGGLSSGEWRFFGDFERQSIYGSGTDTLGNFLSGRGRGVPMYSLRTNCRNTPRVATLVHLLSHLDPDYSSVLRPDNGIEPDLRFYASDEQAPAVLAGVLDELRDDGYRGRDVVVLSPRSNRSAAQRLAQEPWADRLRPLAGPSNGHSRYGTIHAFKGLEAPAIVVTDLEDVTGPIAEALFYIAVTRPTERLVLLIAASARASMARSLARSVGAAAESHA
jgi:hypothetical protein